MTHRRHLAAALIAVVALAGCSASRPATSKSTSMMMGSMSVTAPPAPVSANQVAIDGFAFAPAILTVGAGTTVTWINRDEEPHTVAASDGSFHSPGMGTGAVFTHTFSAAGTFDYICSIHPMMRGTVVVTG